MLDRGVSIAKVAEIVNVTGREKNTSGKGVNRCIAPLDEHR